MSGKSAPLRFEEEARQFAVSQEPDCDEVAIAVYRRGRLARYILLRIDGGTVKKAGAIAAHAPQSAATVPTASARKRAKARPAG